MSIRSIGIPMPYPGQLKELLKPIQDSYGWVVDSKGKILLKTVFTEKIEERVLENIWYKHKFQLDKLAFGVKNIVLDFQFDLNPEISGLFSCRKISAEQKDFFLFNKVNLQTELGATQDQLIAEEFGIFSWHFHLDSNLFYFSQEAANRFFKKKEVQIEYKDFYSALAPESLQRFTEGMESAINFGKGFKLDLLLDHSVKNQWISFSCRATKDSQQSVWLTGLIRDLEKERTEEKNKHQLDQWLNVGLANLEVKDSEGEILAQWGKNLTGNHIKIEEGRRKSTIFDFRNKPKYHITAETGTPEKPAVQKESTVSHEVERKEIPLNKIILT